MNHVEFSAKLCKGCGYCIKFCPKQIIQMGNVRSAKGYFNPVIEDMSQCIGCLACATVCPEGAIETFKEVEADV